ncbi:hypothetical protein [Bradyrhizobium sp. AZCC 2289]|uniref:hypothetical protein n=1 Tax=Bradyrhizobium sp. AZCC 2289 TaxID=3117026 RepID=UPI002FEFF23E
MPGKAGLCFTRGLYFLHEQSVRERGRAGREFPTATFAQIVAMPIAADFKTALLPTIV